jgi:anti-anti-sigma factor
VTRFSTLQQRSGGILLTLRGEIDLAAVAELRDALTTAVTHVAGLDGDIEVCLRAVTFLDCSAIGSIIAGRNAAHRAGRDLFVSHPTGIVRQVLDRLGDLGHWSNQTPPPPDEVPPTAPPTRHRVQPITPWPHHTADRATPRKPKPATTLPNPAATAGEGTDSHRAVDDPAGKAGQTPIVTAGTLPQQSNHPIHVKVVTLSDDTLDLVDDHPAAQRGLQPFGDDIATADGPDLT